jgi:hypothetical protein
MTDRDVVDPEGEPVALRDELGAPPDPDFEMRLPDGWVRRTAAPETERELEQRLRRRLMEAQRPDLLAEANALLEDSFRQMRESRVIATFMALNDEEVGYLPLPAAMVVRIRSSAGNVNLDPYVRQLIQKEKAQPLFDDKRILRYERESTRDVSGQPLVQSSTCYLTPVPGSKRRRALEVVASYGRPVGMARDDERIELVHRLFDVTVSTLRWKPATRPVAP